MRPPTSSRCVPTDTVGNVATEDLRFVVDLEPPRVTNVDFPRSTNSSSVEIAFEVRDGSGEVAQVFCLFRSRDGA